VEETAPLNPEESSLVRLLLGGTDYTELAGRLGLDPDSVAATARGAVTRLGGAHSEELTQREADRVCDWVLGVVEEEPLVLGSPSARAFAQEALGHLAGLDGIEVRSLPSDSQGAKRFVSPSRRSPVSAPLPKASPVDGPVTPAQKPAETKQAKGRSPKPAGPVVAAPPPNPAPADGTSNDGKASRRGGLLLLGGATVILLAGGLALAGVFEGDERPASKASKPSPQPSTPASADDLPTEGNSNGWKLGRAFPMKPPAGGKAQGAAAASTKDGRVALLVAGNDLPGNTIVGVWLTGDGAATLVSLNQTDAKGRFVLAAPMPSVASSARTILISRESFTPGGARPTRPGATLLSSPFSL